MRNFLMILFIAFQFMSCNAKRDETFKTSSKNSENMIDDINTVGEVRTYKGILPCADCTGIETVLKIYQGDGTIESHGFELTSWYKGKSQDTIEQDGNYNLERGLGEDPDGTIYVLNWDKPEEEQIYYGYTNAAPDKLYLLNSKREIIKSKNNALILTRN
ncbi:copper resistance protein NlpE N-terminal domain-containing protein [Flavobacterium psychroterrae]|uniref:Copper resistance protein NlpE N-terminal domain-containing protein n=1 Tax=Flavobacterium psychroterrae TaxID=2133767 RepID=A0ABS5P5Y3_9FLAO|nr:copper resistance protein NlpE N-terminal domain-containing protein [Flavobacterium psychroterrae]MBS7229659.1 copper resistance protein NlpE N-terminal domain-containing protein [Flavobacterium psychroterrae]